MNWCCFIRNSIFISKVIVQSYCVVSLAYGQNPTSVQIRAVKICRKYLIWSNPNGHMIKTSNLRCVSWTKLHFLLMSSCGIWYIKANLDVISESKTFSILNSLCSSHFNQERIFFFLKILFNFIGFQFD